MTPKSVGNILVVLGQSLEAVGLVLRSAQVKAQAKVQKPHLVKEKKAS